MARRETAEVQIDAQEYRVSLVPWDPDDDEFHLWDITVARRGRDTWAVLRHGHQCLGADGIWDWEPSPSNREDDWLETHRFNLETALKLAAEQAGKVTINGFTAEDHLRRRRERADDVARNG